MSALFLVLIPALLFIFCICLVMYFHNSNRIRVKKIISEDLNGKRLFVLRLNSHDFLFEEKAGEVSFLSNIKSPHGSGDLDFVYDSVEEKALKLLELENAGHS